MSDQAPATYNKIKFSPAQGHEIPLASMIKNKFKVRLCLMTGEWITGTVTAFDKFTITLMVDDGPSPYQTTFFKHGILSFRREV